MKIITFSSEQVMLMQSLCIYNYIESLISFCIPHHTNHAALAYIRSIWSSLSLLCR